MHELDVCCMTYPYFLHQEKNNLFDVCVQIYFILSKDEFVIKFIKLKIGIMCFFQIFMITELLLTFQIRNQKLNKCCLKYPKYLLCESILIDSFSICTYIYINFFSILNPFFIYFSNFK